jgi:hypothetical protein
MALYELLKLHTDEERNISTGGRNGREIYKVTRTAEVSQVALSV